MCPDLHLGFVPDPPPDPEPLEPLRRRWLPPEVEGAILEVDAAGDPAGPPPSPSRGPSACFSRSAKVIDLGQVRLLLFLIFLHEGRAIEVLEVCSLLCAVEVLIKEHRPQRARMPEVGNSLPMQMRSLEAPEPWITYGTRFPLPPCEGRRGREPSSSKS